MRELLSGVFAALILAALPSIALAESAGTTKGVNPLADAALDGASRTLVVGSDIFIGDQVSTGPKGQVQILFNDQTKLVIGPNSSLKMADYLVRNNGDPGKFVVDVLSGSFRFATGDAPKNKYEINTPTGTIGVRGTGYDGYVGPDRVTYILHYFGVVLFKAKGEKNWQELHDLCTLGEISSEAKVVGDTRTMSKQARDVLRGEFRYADNQGALLRPFWFAHALECLRVAPDLPQTYQGPALEQGQQPPPPPDIIFGFTGGPFSSGP